MIEAPAVGALQRVVPARGLVAVHPRQEGIELRGRAAAPRTSAASASVCAASHCGTHAGVHQQPAVRAVRHAALAQPVEPRVALGRVEHSLQRVAAVQRRARRAATASRCRSWLPSRQVAASPSARRRRSTASDCRAAVDEVAEHVQRGRATARSRSRRAGGRARRRSPAGRRSGSACRDSATLAALSSRGTPSTRWRAPLHGRRASRLPDPAQRLVRHVGDGAHRGRKARLQVMVEAGEAGAQAAIDLHDNPTQAAVHGADRHHVDRHPQRHRRRGRVLGAAGGLAARRDARARRARGRDQRHRAGGGDHHLPDHHLRRAGAQAARPDVPRDGGAPGGAADGVAVDARRGRSSGCCRSAPTRCCGCSASATGRRVA